MQHWRETALGDAVAVPQARRYRGEGAYLSGLAAETSVERVLVDRGLRLLERRWRGPGGEVDLILAEGETIVFVEVKKAATHAAAADRIRPAQAGRIARSAMAYLERCPAGSLTDMRIDVALVDRVGHVEILENAFSGYW